MSCLHGGQFDEAISYYDDALAELNVRRPNFVLGKLMALLVNKNFFGALAPGWQTGER